MYAVGRRTVDGALAAGVLVTLTLGHGHLRLATPAGTTGRKVALVATDNLKDLLHRCEKGVDAAVAGSATIVVLPEKAFTATDLPFDRLGAEAVAGGEGEANLAMSCPSGVRYAKHHLIPGLEDGLRPGTGPAFLDGGRIVAERHSDRIGMTTVTAARPGKGSRHPG